MHPDVLLHAAELLNEADALLVAAGAGMGVDSGLPDFRGREGFWRAYPALGRAGLDFTEIASPLAFERDAALAWGFYGHRLALYRRTQPHAGFGLLRAWAQALPLGGFVFTSNVDGQFQRAGWPEAEVHECHGSLMHLQCLHACDGLWPAASFLPELDETACRLTNAAPRCPRCGALARPNVLMFGDDGWQPQRSTQQALRLQTWLRRVAAVGARLVVVEVGAGTAIPSVRHFGEQLTQTQAARLIRINPRESALPAAIGVGLPMGALEGLQALDAARRRRPRSPDS